ncbi:phage tail tape measure protein [Amycolatopsis kentuckyensis]|uniref:phage tail tape measure protein n=1 Tax=Amycolatopsis kentuckyensis TaxID=218823 RepID=UPI003561CBEC
MQEVADLYIRLRSNAAELLPQFQAAGLAGESMAAKISTSVASILRENEALMRSMGAMTTKADEMALQYTIDYQRMAAQTIRSTTEMEAANARAAASTEAMAAKIDAAAASTAATTAGKVALVQKAALGIGAVGIGVAAVTVKMAGDFEAATMRLVTSAGESHDNLELVRRGILDMAGSVGYSSMELAKAMYTIGSGGQHGADGLKVLQAAAEGAKAENAELETVADAVTSVMVDYHLKAEDAANVTSKLVAATSVGKSTFQELSASMAAVLPVASAAHVSLDDILGSLSSMTVHGMSAQQSAQNLTDVIRHMQSPTSVQAKELAMLGINSQDLAQSLGERGLSGTLQMIANRIRESMGPDATRVILNMQNALRGLPPEVQKLGQSVINGTTTLKQFTADTKALDPISAAQARSFATLAASFHQLGGHQMTGAQVMQSYGQALAKSTGDATGLNVALMLTGENAEITNDKVRAISQATSEAGGHVKGWADIQGTFNTKVAQAKDGLGALAIAVGTELLPVFSKIAGVIADVTGWLSRHETAAKVLAVVVGGALVVAFSALLAVFWGFASNPVTWIIAGIVVAVLALAAGVYLLISNWDSVASFFVGIWNAIKNAFSTAIDWVVNLLSGWIDWIKALPGKILSGIASLGSMIGNFFRNAWNSAVDATRRGIDAAIQFVKDLPRKIGYALGFLAGLLLRTAIDAWNSFTTGIKNAWNATVQFFRELPGRVKAFLVDAGNWLVQKGMDLLIGLGRGIINAYESVKQWFVELPGKVKAFFSDAWNWLVQKGADLLVGLRNGITNAYEGVKRWFHDLPGNVKSFLADAGSWLLNAGHDLIVGLWNGISAMGGWLWQKVKDFAGGVIQGFKDALGIASPSKLMIELGQFLAQGLAVGIDNHADTAVSAATAMADRVTKASAVAVNLSTGVAGRPATSSSGTGAAAPSAVTAGGLVPLVPVSGGGTTQIVNVAVNVAGSVLSEVDLQKVVQKIVIRFAGRNNGPGFTPAFT